VGHAERRDVECVSWEFDVEREECEEERELVLVMREAWRGDEV
jgi:hypothetical protein